MVLEKKIVKMSLEPLFYNEFSRERERESEKQTDRPRERSAGVSPSLSTIQPGAEALHYKDK